MKNLLKIIILIVMPLTCIISQENQDNQEVGVRLNSLDNYDLIYKNQVSENKYLRLRTVDVNFSVASREFGSTQYRMGAGFAIGLESRKALTDRFDFIMGYEAIASLNYFKVGDNATGTYRFGAGVVIGFNYKFTDRINFGVETIPAIIHSRNFGDSQRISSTSIGFNSSDVNLLATYRF